MISIPSAESTNDDVWHGVLGRVTFRVTSPQHWRQMAGRPLKTAARATKAQVAWMETVSHYRQAVAKDGKELVRIPASQPNFFRFS